MSRKPEASSLNRHELAGAVADLGVLVPIAVALMIKNGLEATAVLLPAGLLYLTVAYVYRLPVSVQPLKAFGAIAIAEGLGPNEIAAGAITIGAIFVLMGSTGLIDLAKRAFPTPLIRGVQLGVGLLLLEIGWGLVADAPPSFDNVLAPSLAIPLALAALVCVLVFRKQSVTLLLVLGGSGIALALAGGELALGPSELHTPSLDGAVFWSALTALVIPQIPLTFANSCLAAADAAKTYYGERAKRVRPGRLAVSLGGANLFAGAITGMPVCHGAGGITAHYKFGARTYVAPLVMGGLLVALALIVGAGLAGVLASFPLPALAALLGAAGILHIGLLADLEHRREWAVALLVGVGGFATNLAIGLGVGLVVWWVDVLVRRRLGRYKAPTNAGDIPRPIPESSRPGWDMSESLLQSRLRAGYEAFSSGDFENAAKFVHPDFAWIPNMDAFSSGVEGRDQFIDFMKPEVFDEQKVEVLELIEHPPRILACVRFSIRGRASGIEIDDTGYHVWTFEGDLATRCVAFSDRNAAFAALEDEQ